VLGYLSKAARAGIAKTGGQQPRGLQVCEHSLLDLTHNGVGIDQSRPRSERLDEEGGNRGRSYGGETSS
jgi:hypothetical protein